MTNHSPSAPNDAVDVLRHVEAVRNQARRQLAAFWFPLVVFGALTLVSAPVQWAWPGPAVAAFWAVAGPLGGGAVAWHYRSRELRVGLGRSAVPYVLTAVGLVAGAFVLPAVTTGDLRQVVSVFAVAGGYLVFAWLDRSRTLALLAVGMAAIAALVLVADVDHPGALAAVAVGIAFLATGLVSRRSS